MRASLKLIILTAALVVVAATQANTRSLSFRIEGDGFVTTAAVTVSSNFTMKLTGGSGAPIGPAGSPAYTLSSGPGLTSLPTEQIFNNSFE